MVHLNKTEIDFLVTESAKTHEEIKNKTLTLEGLDWLDDVCTAVCCEEAEKNNNFGYYNAEREDFAACLSSKLARTISAALRQRNVLQTTASRQQTLMQATAH